MRFWHSTPKILSNSTKMFQSTIKKGFFFVASTIHFYWRHAHRNRRERQEVNGTCDCMNHNRTFTEEIFNTFTKKLTINYNQLQLELHYAEHEYIRVQMVKNVICIVFIPVFLLFCFVKHLHSLFVVTHTHSYCICEFECAFDNSPVKLIWWTSTHSSHRINVDNLQRSKTFISPLNCVTC